MAKWFKRLVLGMMITVMSAAYFTSLFLPSDTLTPQLTIQSPQQTLMMHTEAESSDHKILMEKNTLYVHVTLFDEVPVKNLLGEPTPPRKFLLPNDIFYPPKHTFS